MDVASSKAPSTKREDPTFSRNEYIDNVFKDAIVHESDDSDRDFCTSCEQETPDWDLPVGYNQPPHMPTGPLCLICWVMAAADIWEEEAADQRAAAKSAGPL